MSTTQALNYRQEYLAAQAKDSLNGAPRYCTVIFHEKGYIVEQVSGLSGENLLIKMVGFCNSLKYFTGKRNVKLMAWWKEDSDAYIVYHSREGMEKQGH